jgi:hypothetical protein
MMMNEDTPARSTVALLPSALVAGWPGSWSCRRMPRTRRRAGGTGAAWPRPAITSSAASRRRTRVPAIQGSLDFGHSNGFYTGVWASNVDFDQPTASTWRSTSTPAGCSRSRTRPSSTCSGCATFIPAPTGFGINYNEYIAAYSFLDNYTATVAWSDDFLRTDESAFYYNLGAEYELGVAELNLVVAARATTTSPTLRAAISGTSRSASTATSACSMPTCRISTPRDSTRTCRTSSDPRAGPTRAWC